MFILMGRLVTFINLPFNCEKQMKNSSVIILSLIIILCLIWSAYRIICFSKIQNRQDVYIRSGKWDNVPLTKAKIYNSIRDAGNVASDILISEEFVIENIGKDSLFVKEIIPDCTCTDFSISVTEIPVGSNAILTLYADTKNRIGGNALTTIISLNTEEEDHIALLKYSVTSETCEDAKSEYDWGTSILNIGTIRKDIAYKFKNILKNNTENITTVYDPIIANDYISVLEMVDQINPDESIPILFTIQTNFVGSFEEIIALPISDDNKVLHFRVKGESVE